uniref:Clc-like protein n=1 Tax=Plectus sambesii TaxID=2011161 RepID=A0A914X004_9BILA
MVIGVIWSIVAVASAAWQVVDLREYQTEHEHGLWQDCARTSKSGYSEGAAYQTAGALHCTYKFDYSPGQLVPVESEYVDENSPAGENKYHVFHAYQVSTLVLVLLSVLLGIIAVCISCGAMAYPMCALINTILAFICLLLTFGAVASFFIVAHRADNRFVKGVVGQYEAILGRAYYFEVVSCVVHFLAFVCSLLTSYLFLRADDTDDRRRRGSLRRSKPLPEYPTKYVSVVEISPTYAGSNASLANNGFRGLVTPV